MMYTRAGRYDGIYRATVEMCLPGEIWLYRFNRGILLYYIFALHVSIKCLVVVLFFSFALDEGGRIFLSSPP